MSGIQKNADVYVVTTTMMGIINGAMGFILRLMRTINAGVNAVDVIFAPWKATALAFVKSATAKLIAQENWASILPYRMFQARPKGADACAVSIAERMQRMICTQCEAEELNSRGIQAAGATVGESMRKSRVPSVREPVRFVEEQTIVEWIKDRGSVK